MLDFIEIKPTANELDNTYLVIMLHGWGSNNEDLISLSKNFEMDFNNIHYISVNAPFKCEAGFGYQWFSLKNINPYSIMIDIKNNYKIIEDFIEEQSKKLSIDYSHIFLLGFSQGAMMSIYTSIRLNKKLAGVIVLSGLLPETIDTMKINLKTKQKVLMIHGTEDNVVPYEYFLQSEKLLKMSDFDVNAISIDNMSHEVNEQVIIEIKKFLNSCINNIDIEE